MLGVFLFTVVFDQVSAGGDDPIVDTCENDLWDNCSSDKCCPGQSMCFRMTEWYSQCRIFCPDGWHSATVDCTFDAAGELGEINSCAWRDWSFMDLEENIYKPERVDGPDE